MECQGGSGDGLNSPAVSYCKSTMPSDHPAAAEELTELTQNLFTAADFIRWGATALATAGVHCGHGFDNALDEAYYLVRDALALPHNCPPAYLHGRLMDGERRTLAERLLLRRDTRLPAAYITNEAWFAGMPFYVDQRVIIPRSPIAEVIEQGCAPWVLEPPRRILDLCCGSGCIGIAAASVFEDAEVVLADLSDDALAVAQLNIEQHGLGDRVSAVKSDLFSGLADQQFDLILTNPPYVPIDDVDALPAEFAHEPRMALESGTDGLDHPRQIIEQARALLSDDGVLIGEVGAWWQALDAAFPAVPLVWLDLQRGGEGVFAVRAQDLPK